MTPWGLFNTQIYLDNTPWGLFNIDNTPWGLFNTQITLLGVCLILR